MADAKITALSENTTPIGTDIIPIVDDPGGTPATQKVTLNSLAGTTLFNNNSLSRQAIMNGNFDVWQRGTSFTANGVIADRWYRYGTALTVSRQDGTGVTGSQYSVRTQRDSGNAGTGTRYLMYAGIETKDAIKLRGQKLTLSFWAKCGANYSPTSALLTNKIQTGTGTDENYGNGDAYTTGNAVIATQNSTLTTSWQKFTLTTAAVVAATVNEISITFLDTPVGTAGANDWFEITQVQLCSGDVALPFMPKSFSQELLDCRRYYFRPQYQDTLAYTYYYHGFSISTTSATLGVSLPCNMRTTPTVGYSTLSKLGITNGAGSLIAVTAMTLYSGFDGTILTITVASGLTAGQGTYMARNNDTGGYVDFSAEL